MTERIRQIPLKQIEVGKRLRTVDDEAAARIARSMEAVGQLSPIDVHLVGDGAFRLISGAHRLAAAHLLGWDSLMASVFTGDALKAQLREIDENLHRAELSAYDEATFLERRWALWVGLYGKPQHGGDRRSTKYRDANLKVEAKNAGFYEATADALGVSASTVRRAVRRRLRLGDYWNALGAFKEIAKGQHLDDLAKLAPLKLPTAVRLIQDGVPIDEAIARAKPSKRSRQHNEEKQLKHLRRAWDNATPIVRASFLEDIGATIKTPKGKA